MTEEHGKRELDLIANTVDGKPLILVVDNDEICDDACTTLHVVRSCRDGKVVLWNGRYYIDEDEFAEDYADKRINALSDEMDVWPHAFKKLEAEAAVLWAVHAIDCVVLSTTGMLTLDCEVR